MTPATPNDGVPARAGRTCPEGFHDWPLERRNEFFAKEAAVLAARQKRRATEEALFAELERTRKEPKAAKQQSPVKAFHLDRAKANTKPEPKKQADPDPWDRGAPQSADGVGDPTRSRFKLVDWNDVEFNPNEEWRVEGVLPVRGFGLIYGKPRSFKSFNAIDIALHVVLGSAWAGKLVEKGRVVYIAAEGAAGMPKRIEAYRRRHKVPRGDFALISAAPNLGAAEGDLPALIEAIRSSGIKPDVAVVDTASKSIGAAEENSTGMAAFVGNAEKLAQAFDCLVLGVHHVGLGEDAQKRPRGWSGLGGALDVQILCERSGDERRTTLTVQKLKDEEDGICFEAHLSRVVVGVDKNGKEASTLIVDDVFEIDAAAKKATTGKDVPRSGRMLMDIVALALDESGVAHRPFGWAGPEVRAVADSHIRERYFARVAEKAAPDEDPRRLYERQFKAFNRSIKAAIDAKTLIAGDHEGERFIWLP
jgi:AAA domain